ncbi:cell wall metabolism sensor histidine kinase WalK [Bacillus litorisediminis]|uniref:cell wall metabolism sensor histidine kinase WalK n=1 Tax=Bacillus litorisediminis TaxID=2922713 RepID=UPI001FB0479E|nr:cell wall metabolism sensor histidine kinase WalK [Bacillus litorisediminis]
MKKVSFFQSIHLKFVLVYVLLILIAMQIIGVYFSRQLENQFIENFQNSITDRMNLLSYSIEEAIAKIRDDEDPILEVEVSGILRGYSGGDILEVRVIDINKRIIGTSETDNQNVVGQITTDKDILQSMAFDVVQKAIYRDGDTGNRIWKIVQPIRIDGEVRGAIYLKADIESVFDQLQEINDIFANATVIALSISVILGILLAQAISRPITDMRRQALAMAKGNFSRKVKVYGLDEIGQLALTFNNLTKRLQEAQATTEGERRKLASVLAYMTDGVIATDRRGRIILINESAIGLLNVSRETALSQQITTLLGIEEKYTFEDLINEQESVILDYSTPHKPYILRANFSVIQKDSGIVNGLIAVLHDITEQEKIEMERREFVANVSHELRTPLTSMRSYLEALSDGAWKDEEIAPRFLEVTQTETERMIRLVNDLLQLSKMDSKDYRFQKEIVDFTIFFNRIIDRFDIIKEQHVTFTRELPSKTIFVEIDEDKMTQVLDNVISNALKYSPEGGNITFRLEEGSDEIQISVSDEGVGIPKDQINKIFDRFYRVDKARSRKFGGTGLGLAIAKEMVEAHGGKIWAESKDEVGTTIFITLPYEHTDEDDWA